MTIENNNNLNLDLNDDIQTISGLLNIEKNMVIFYPDKVRKMLLENYFYEDIDVHSMQELTGILQDYIYSLTKGNCKK